MLEELLRATSAATREGVRRNVRRAMARLAARAGLSVAAYEDRLGLRGLLHRALGAGHAEGFDPVRLAALIRRLKLRLEEVFDLLPSPWHSWVPGSTLHVIVGERSAPLGGAGAVDQPFVGGRDFRALAALTRLLYENLGLDARVQEHLLSPTSEVEALALLDRLGRDPRAGGVVCLGGPNVNPATDVLARRICDGLAPEQLPARFQWSHAWAWQGAPFLTNPALCPVGDEGLRLRDGTILRRPSDRQVIAERRASKDAGPFEDHGLVLVDARGPVLRVCLCGHGGWGTVAATWALEFLADRVAEGRLGRDRAFEVVTVDREKPSDLPCDDLDASEDPLLGWGFHWRAPGTSPDGPVPDRAPAPPVPRPSADEGGLRGDAGPPSPRRVAPRPTAAGHAPPRVRRRTE